MTPVYTGSSAAAPKLYYHAEPAKAAAAVATVAPKESSENNAAVAAALPPLTRKPITYQPSLFNSREYPRVVAFETIAPTAPEPVRKPSAPRPRVRHRKLIPGQQSLEFAPTAGSGRLNRPAEGAIYCSAPVAIPAHRFMAAALDATVIVLALAAFGAIFYNVSGSIVISSKTLPLLAGVTIVVTAFYKLLFSMANGDSPGMRWARLTLVNFDGQRPTRSQRLHRLLSGFLSFFAAGLGLFWALVDEETLTWHDHISSTFPTPY